MTAISTNIILLYKQKYTAIGQGTGGAPVGSGDDEAIRNWKDKSTIGKDIESAVKYNNAIANLNVGLATFNNIQQDLNGSIVKMAESITMLEDREADLTKVFKTGTEVLALRTKAYNTLQSKIGATNDQMAQYRATMEINSSLLGQAFAKNATETNGYVANTTKAYNYLSKTTDLTSEQQSKLELYSAGAGRSLLQQVAATKALTGEMKGIVDPSTAFEEATATIADMSADIRQQYRGTNGALEIAVLRSKKLGISMQQLHKTGESLLNIEASVGKELEYQLISGKRLVDNQGNSLTNMYRQAFMSGDASKMQDAMTKVYETQSDVLEGNNYLAKQALAESLGMSQQELMASHEKYKLQQKITAEMGDQYDLDTIMKQDPAKQKAFKLQLEMADSDLAKSFEKIAETEDRSSPAQRILLELRSLRDQGLNVNINKNGIDTLKQARTAATEYKDAAMKPMSGPSGLFANEAIAKIIGKYQVTGTMLDTMNTAIGKVSKTIPYFGNLLITAVQKMKTTAEYILGTQTIERASKKVDKTKPPTGGKAIESEDSVLNINDGVIAKFHPNDKITTVVASPYGAMNERVASKIANPPSNTNGSNEIAQLTNAINNLISKQSTSQQPDSKSIVSAIQLAMGNIQMTVNVDPMAIDKEIKFRSGNLNGSTI